MTFTPESGAAFEVIFNTPGVHTVALTQSAGTPATGSITVKVVPPSKASSCGFQSADGAGPVWLLAAALVALWRGRRRV